MEGLLTTSGMREVRKGWEGVQKGSREPRPEQRASVGTAEEGVCFLILTGSLLMQRPCTNPTFSSKPLYSRSLMQCQEKKQLLHKESSQSERKRA